MMTSPLRHFVIVGVVKAGGNSKKKKKFGLKTVFYSLKLDKLLNCYDLN